MDCRGMDCEQVVGQLWDYLDGELTDERMNVIRAHLAACAGCYPHFDFERAFLEALASTRTDEPTPISLKQRVLAKLRLAGCQLTRQS